jgi:hypothetical protein
MSAFFSGTDDTNDAPTIRFSGVFGKLNTPKAETIWRFNYLTKKYKVEVSDMFLPENSVPVPQEWLDQVTVTAPTTIAYGGYSGPGNVVRGGKADHLRPYQYQPNAPRNNSALANDNWDRESLAAPFNGFGMDADLDEDMREYYAAYDRAYNHGNQVRPAPANQRNVASSPTPDTTGKVWRYTPDTSTTNQPPLNPVVKGQDISKITQALSEQQEEIDQAVDEASIVNLSENPNADEEVGAYQMGKPQQSLALCPNANDDSLVFSNQEPSSFIDEQYDVINLMHGTDVADAWLDIDSSMHVLSEKDDLLHSLMFDMFELQSEDAKAEFFRALFERIPSNTRTAIEANGF